MTGVQLVTSGEEAACVIGGWGEGHVPMQPHVLRRDDDATYHWTAPTTAGSEPKGRAFHSATQIVPGCLLVYGGLGTGCCRTDVTLLDLNRWVWSSPCLSGVPRCLGGRAGHGAAFFPRATGGGELLLVSGAMRTTGGDAHQGSVDVIDVLEEGGGARGSKDALPIMEEILKLSWSTAEEWQHARLPPVRTAWYWSTARSLVAWSGVSERHGICQTLHVIDADRRCVRQLYSVDLDGSDHPEGRDLPAPRGGALCFPLAQAGSPFEALMLAGSDHEDSSEERLLEPWMMKLDV
jgi:hypothetical protein